MQGKALAVLGLVSLWSQAHGWTGNLNEPLMPEFPAFLQEHGNANTAQEPAGEAAPAAAAAGEGEQIAPAGVEQAAEQAAPIEAAPELAPAAIDFNVGPGASAMSDSNAVEPQYHSDTAFVATLTLPNHRPLQLPYGTKIILPPTTAAERAEEAEEVQIEAEKVADANPEGNVGNAVGNAEGAVSEQSMMLQLEQLAARVEASMTRVGGGNSIVNRGNVNSAADAAVLAEVDHYSANPL